LAVNAAASPLSERGTPAVASEGVGNAIIGLVCLMIAVNILCAMILFPIFKYLQLKAKARMERADMMVKATYAIVLRNA